MLQTAGLVLITATFMTSGCMFLFKYAQAMFKEENRWRNLLTSTLFYFICLLILKFI